jgi:GNAT superfamily N-acetyltransferase
MSNFEVVSTVERPDLHDQFDIAFRSVWPELIFHDAVAKEYVDRVQSRFPTYDVTVVEGDRVVAGGWGVALAWDQTIDDLPTGYDDALVRSFSTDDLSSFNTLSLMAIAVRADCQGKGLSSLVIASLRERAGASRLRGVIAPVRPTLKASYPLVEMAKFAKWRSPDGQHVDPWIRIHERLGARILGPAPRSMVITGSVAEWESWTGMLFPESGTYVVPDALDLVEIDRDADLGTYIEPNLWMQHD